MEPGKRPRSRRTEKPAAPVGPADLAPELAQELQAGGPAAGEPVALDVGAGAIAATLQEIAELLQLTNANAFKVRAYENAARTLAGMEEELPELLREGSLEAVPGIGKSIAEKVVTLATTGQLPYLDELRAQVPKGLVELLRIPGLGPKKAVALHAGLGVESVEGLEAACRMGALQNLPGFGARTAENILLGIEQLRRVQGTFLWSFAADAVAPILAALRRHPAVQRLEVAGSLRRRKETVHDVDILLSTADPEPVMAAFASGEWAERVLGSGETKTSVVHPSGLQLDLRAVTDAQYPYALHHFTGSKQHNIAMRGRAQQKFGIKMNEYGLFRGEESIPCGDEAAIFAALGLAWIPPELREDEGEIEAAEHGRLPARLLELDDLKGAFHVHTTESDGRDTLRGMVRAAKERGFEYVGISDHSQSAVYARGLDAGRVAAQRRAIDSVQRAVPGIRVFHGIESDILPDGRLDYEDEVLSGFDFVIAAVHSVFNLSRDEQTRRILRAIQNPYTTILGHPTGRILLRREGYDVDLAAVLEEAARRGVVVEIDAHPQRLDLDGAGARLARDKGTLVCISPDAHAVSGLGDLRYGIGTARRGWLGPEHVLNTRGRSEMEAYLQQRRERGGGSRQ